MINDYTSFSPISTATATGSSVATGTAAGAVNDVANPSNLVSGLKVVLCCATSRTVVVGTSAGMSMLSGTTEAVCSGAPHFG